MVTVDSESAILNGRKKGAHLSLFVICFPSQGGNVNPRQKSSIHKILRCDNLLNIYFKILFSGILYCLFRLH